MTGDDLSDDIDDGYGESSRYAAHLDRGWSLLERGEYARARASAEEAVHVRAESPEPLLLLGAIALSEGHAEQAAEHFRRAIALDPEYIEPYASLAQILLWELGDPAGALALCEEALELDEIVPLDEVELGLTAAEAALVLGRRDHAHEALLSIADGTAWVAAMDAMIADDDDATQGHLTELVAARGDLDEDERTDLEGRVLALALRAGRVWLDLDNPALALSMLARVTTIDPEDSDAWALSVEAHAMANSPRASAFAALQTYRIEARRDLPPWVPDAPALHSRVLEILAAIPERYLIATGEPGSNLVVLIHEAPGLELVLEGLDPRIPCLALGARGSTEIPTLTGFAIYRRNLAHMSTSAEHFDLELDRAVREELAAFHLLPDALRRELGLAPLEAAGPLQTALPYAPELEGPLAGKATAKGKGARASKTQKPSTSSTATKEPAARKRARRTN